MKGVVTRMLDKTIEVVSAGLATVLLRKQVLVLPHSEVGRRMTGIPGGTEYLYCYYCQLLHVN